MGNRSRHKSRHHRETKPPMPLAQIMRTHCTECGSPVQWLTVEEAQARGIDLGPALALFEGDAEVWVCTACDNFGVMGGTEYGTI